jgi:hypothetical protein
VLPDTAPHRTSAGAVQLGTQLPRRLGSQGLEHCCPFGVHLRTGASPGVEPNVPAVLLDG